MKVAVIGAGRMGRRHIQVVKNLGLTLVGVCDLHAETLAVATKEFSLASETQFSEPATMLSQMKPDIVIIAATAPTHCELTCASAEAGAKFILCEKPMAISIAECDRMIEVCRRHGTKLAINHQMRFMEQYIEPKRLADSPEFGGLTSVTVIGGNFGVAMNGSHYFEMFRFLTGEYPTTAQAWFSRDGVPNPRGPQFQDRAGSVRLTVPSGKRFYMEIGSDQGHGMNVVYAGKHGRIFTDELAGSFDAVFREEIHRALPTTRYGMPWVSETKKIIPADAIKPSESVLDALIKNQNYPTGEDGRAAVATLVAAYVSSEDGHRVVAIDQNLPKERTFPWA